MTGEPPNWDDAPPASPDDYGQPSGGNRGGNRGGNDGGGRGARRPAQTALTKDEIAVLSADFYEWIDRPGTLKDLIRLLPANIDPGVFIATAKTAVLAKPKMLRENLRPSLLTAVLKAAGMGLLPDGKQGALVERYDSEAKEHLISFQPMVWGIVKLGRETGAIRSIRAVLVFRGENFHILAGEDDRIEHEVDPDIVEEAYAALHGGKDQWHNPVAKPEAFLERVRAAYCFITADDGTVTRRWMTHNRIMSLYEATKAKNGPWNSRWIDEMILKGVILYASKWINLDKATVEARGRFQSAMLDGLEVDFTTQGQIAAPTGDQGQAKLPPPGDKLSTLEDQIMGKMNAREKVSAKPVSEGIPLAKQDRAGTTGGAGGRATPPGPRTAAKQQPAVELPFIDRACAALEKDRVGRRWMLSLIAALRGIETTADLIRLGKLSSVVENRKTAPPDTRTEIGRLFQQAAEGLAPQHDGKAA